MQGGLERGERRCNRERGELMICTDLKGPYFETEREWQKLTATSERKEWGLPQIYRKDFF